MKSNETDTNPSSRPNAKEERNEPEGYPVYPENEDIYYRFRKEKRVDPEDITKTKELAIVRKENDGDFSEDVLVRELDIPEFEPDEIEEFVGIEDEGNNYFSPAAEDQPDREESLGY